MEGVFKIILKDITLDILKYIIPSIIFGFLSGILLYYINKFGIKTLILEVKKNFLEDRSYKWKILFFTYIYFIFDKTLLSRTFGANNNLELALTIPNILKMSNIKDNIEAIENLIFFIPYTFFLLQGFSIKKLKNILFMSFFTSLLIEILQFIIKIGTFQLSDLLYNTLGGVIGYIIYRIINIKNKGEKNEKKLS